MWMTRKLLISRITLMYNSQFDVPYRIVHSNVVGSSSPRSGFVTASGGRTGDGRQAARSYSQSTWPYMAFPHSILVTLSLFSLFICLQLKRVHISYHNHIDYEARFRNHSPLITLLSNVCAMFGVRRAMQPNYPSFGPRPGGLST